MGKSISKFIQKNICSSFHQDGWFLSNNNQIIRL